MDLETLDALCEILAVRTLDPAHCFFGLCTIQGWEDSFSADELQPLLSLLSGRDHIVLSGPLPAIDQIEYDSSTSASFTLTAMSGRGEKPLLPPAHSEYLQRKAPKLIWPADRSWFVANEVDFDSTLVGGSTALITTIHRLLQARGLAGQADRFTRRGRR